MVMTDKHDEDDGTNVRHTDFSVLTSKRKFSTNFAWPLLTKTWNQLIIIVIIITIMTATNY